MCRGCCRSFLFPALLHTHSLAHADIHAHMHTHTYRCSNIQEHVCIESLVKYYCNLEICACANASLLRMQRTYVRICRDAMWNFTSRWKPAVPLGLNYTPRIHYSLRERESEREKGGGWSNSSSFNAAEQGGQTPPSNHRPQNRYTFTPWIVTLTLSNGRPWKIHSSE